MSIRRVLHIILLLSFIVAAFFAQQTLKRPDVFPIQTVRIEGKLTYLSRQHITQMATPYVNTGFFAFSPNELREQLMTMPWVASAAITRSWPDTVTIAIKEKKAIARWDNEGIVAENGDVFFPDNQAIPNNLPRFFGPPTLTKTMVTTFHEMQACLAPLSLSIKELRVSERHAWTAVLNNDIRLELGRTDVLKRVQRFVKAYHKIVSAHVESIEQIDLRYTNGLAVKWKLAPDGSV